MSLRSKRKFWRLVGIVTASILLVVGGAGGGYKYWTDRKAAEKKAHDAIEEAKRDEEREAERKRRKALAEWTDEESPVPASFKDPSWGDRAAPVTIVIFSELECTACKALDATLTELKKSYGPKTLRVIWKHNPASSHKIGRQAAIAGHAVFRSTGSEAFFKYVSKGFASGKDDLYGFQIEEWVREAGVKKTVEYNKLKLEKETEEKVDADVALAATLGVKASPACFINGVLVKGAIPLAKLKSVVDEQVTKAQAEVDKGTAKEQVYVTLSKAQFVSKEERLKALEPPKDDDKAALKVPVTDSPALGPATALVTIVEFGDFDCPHCQSVHKTLLELKASYGDKLRLVWKDNPLPNHYRARAAANFARDVRAQKGDEAFWKVHGLMLESGKLSEDDLKGYAKKVGVKVPGAIDASTQGTHDAKIRLDQDLAESLDATGTPTFFINGRRLVGAKQKTEIEALIKEEETKAQALLSGGTAASSLYDEIMKSAKDPSDAVTKIVSPGDPPYGAPKRGATLPSVVIQHFGDIESPATKKVEQTLDRIVDKYRDQVQVVWRHRPMEDHEHAVDLAHAAEDLKSQVSDAAFFSFVKAASGKSGTPGAFDLPNIQALAQEAGKVDRYGYVSIYSIKNAIDEKKHEAKLNADLLKASELEIQIAPTVIVGKELLVSPVTFARVKKLVDKSLGK